MFCCHRHPIQLNRASIHHNPDQDRVVTVKVDEQPNILVKSYKSYNLVGFWCWSHFDLTLKVSL